MYGLRRPYAMDADMQRPFCICAQLDLMFFMIFEISMS
jgi:hypothetical protein